MELKKLILKNFRSHKNLSLDFSSGITGIIGGNGSGKSSIVESILFILTGEGYAKTKADMISVGEVTGYVIAYMIIDGKEAILERHLDSAKVNFKYEDKVYKKSSEVHELWDKLFQIDKNIVHNVIVSNQGEIALLFNGDASTREKLFQKIFMVPNTTKLRETIWNNYIKTAPPAYMLKDEQELQATLKIAQENVVKSKNVLEGLKLNNLEYNTLLARKNYLYQVVHSKQLVEMCSHEIYYLNSQIALLQVTIVNKQQEYTDIDTATYIKEIAELDANKPLFELKKTAEQNLSCLKCPAYNEVDATTLKTLHDEIITKETEVTLKRKTASDILSKIKEYERSGLASGVCPTCKSEVKDIASLVEHLNNELDPLIISGKKLKEEIDQLKEQKTLKQFVVDEYNKYTQEKNRLIQILELYKDVHYDETKHQELKSALAKCQTAKVELDSLNTKLKNLETSLNAKKIELAGAVKYDRIDMDLDTEIQQVNEDIDTYEQNKKTADNLALEIALNEQKIKDTEKQLNENKDLAEKNKIRQKYLDSLQAVYDIFHTSKFPRALIQTYADIVSEYMSTVLASFDFPYTAKVNELFGIDVFNSDGLQLPNVSGGQQVMIGLSLRLALHNMFVGAFPLMIIDEGSYGLAAENSQKYFNIISELNKSDKFKQVIVIDHHPELSDYVDNTISL
jgi:exonuclease SbcC